MIIPVNASQRLRQSGLSLIELMVALVLGLIVVGGAMSIFLSNQEASRTTENLSRMQESSRVAFELMSRSLREAGGNPCGTTLVANVLTNSSTAWWANWANNTIRGYAGTAASPAVTIGTGTGQRVTGTDSIILMSGSSSGVSIVQHDASATRFKVNTTTHGIRVGSLLMACDYKQAAIFQATSADSSSANIVHATGGTLTPGNCNTGLLHPTNCSSTTAAYTFDANGYLVSLSSEAWYVGNNAQGGRSLYRVVPTVNSSGQASTSTEEIAANVTNMQLTYLTRNATDYVAAGSVSDWTSVIAVSVELTLTSTNNVATTDSAPQVSRRLVHVATLRNRAP